MTITKSALTNVPSILHVENGRQHPIYRNFYLMHYRVHNHKNLKCYTKYQEKDISICPEWDDFEVFIAEMLPSYIEGYVLDRINNDGNYCKENCQWLSQTENTVKDNNQEICEYTLNGAFIKKHISRTEAAKSCNGSLSGICRANRLSIPFKGRRWLDVEDSQLPLEVLNKVNYMYVPVKQIDFNTLEVIKEWDHCQQAAKALDLHQNAIGKVCKGELIQTGGFRWAYSYDVNTGEIPEISNRLTSVTKKVVQYQRELEIVIIDKYLDIKEASKLTKIKPSKITRAIETKGTCEGFGWIIDEIGLVCKCEYSIKLTELKTFNSLEEAGKECGIAATNITSVCKGIKPSAGGYSWKYAQ